MWNTLGQREGQKRILLYPLTHPQTPQFEVPVEASILAQRSAFNHPSRLKLFSIRYGVAPSSHAQPTCTCLCYMVASQTAKSKNKKSVAVAASMASKKGVSGVKRKKPVEDDDGPGPSKRYKTLKSIPVSLQPAKGKEKVRSQPFVAWPAPPESTPDR
ncbi:hypothetical protein JB92DRAFT_2832420 [Gautieria morchelliformis]|nr:hypothetical protein JB92DRAFT_2832420 [Gautieria morchelliformis]